jgi:peroxiredoxin
MVSTLWLLGVVLAPGPVPDRPVSAPPAAARGDWSLLPRLVRGQELLYRGTFTEDAKGPRVQFHRDYRFETRCFVLDAPPRGLDVAILTILRARGGKPAPGVQVSPVSSSVRLERVTVDLHGKVKGDPAVSLCAPLEGAPTLECGAFVESPGLAVAPGRTWETFEPDRPARAWRVVGREVVLGTVCVKLVSLQQSADWDRPRDCSAWRRQDTIWVAPRLGVVQRLERITEQREPARYEATQRSVLRYDLESSLLYPGPLSEDRRQEVLQALAFREAARPMLSAPVNYVRQLTALLAKINYHLERQPPTPYREAVLTTKRQVEAARRGEAAPTPMGTAPRAASVIALGQPAPDFAASDFASSTTMRLSRMLGKPVVLVFYNPASVTAPDLLRFAQALTTTFPRRATVVGLSVSDDANQVIAQREVLKLTFPLLSGGGLRVSYAVETTPKIVVLDAAGVVRGAYIGWGRETTGEVLAELRHWMSKQ